MDEKPPIRNIDQRNIRRYDYKYLVNKNKTESIRDLGEVDISNLQNKVLTLSELIWEFEHNINLNPNVRKSFFQSVKQIIFRISRYDDHLICYDLLNWKLWQDLLLPVMNQAVLIYDYDKVIFPRAMITRLPAKSSIGKHVDKGSELIKPHKIHIPIQTNKQTFFCNPPNHRYHLEVGRAYEVDNISPHAVINDGNCDRIHFIFECLPLLVDSD